MPNLKRSECARIDFETRSRVDVRKVGAHAYARHHSTIVMSATITWRDRKVLFNPAQNRKQARKLIKEIHASGDQIAAYNWSFEYEVIKWVCTRLYDWPMFKPDRFTCTLAKALRFGLPGKLEVDAEFLGAVPKDKEGHRIMLRLTKPRPARKSENPNHLYFDNDPEKHRRSQLYNMRDVFTERDVDEQCPDFSKRELKIYRLDQKMNVHGVRLDVELCHGALKIMAEYRKELLDDIPKKAWRHFHSIGQREVIKQHLNSKLKKRDWLPNMQADTLNTFLLTCTNGYVRKIVTAYVEAGGSAVAKYATALDMQQEGRLVHNLQFCGASNTGRWAGRGVQMQNIFRPIVDFDERAVSLIQSGNYKKFKNYCKSLKLNTDKTKTATVSDVLKSYMRSMLVADHGCWFSVNDYNAIEARKVFWFSGCKKGTRIFKKGDDPYKHMACVIYGIKMKDVTSQQRFVGKQAILGLGYGMGAPAFVEQCLKFGVVITLGLAYKTVNSYRKEFKEVVDYWHQMERTVKQLLETEVKGRWVECGLVQYMWDGLNIQCKLPSGAILYYHRMKIDDNERLSYYTTPRQGGKAMVPRSIWGGTLFENICQASARELMADAMLKLDAHGFVNQLTVHDEMINRITHPEQHNEVQQLILDTPKWAKGLPIAVEGECIDRYRKV